MKKISLFLVVLAVIGLVFTGALFAGGQKEQASGESGQAKEQAEEKGDEVPSVALLLPGSISDHGWNYVAHQALMQVKEELGAEVAFSEKVPASDYEEVFRGYATQGFDVVMGHGFEFGDAALKVAKNFPDTYFIVTSTNISQEPNVASFRINDPQSGFVQGVLAALMTESNVVGTIGGMEIPPIINQQKGFEAGVRYAEEQYLDKEISVRTAMTGSFHDIAKGKEMARAMIEAGADVLVGDADETNLGIFEAVGEADGVVAMGSSGDQATVAPDVVVTSLVEDFGVAFVVLLQDIMKGEFDARAYELGLEDGVVSMAPFRKFEDKVSDQTKERVHEVIEKLKSGEINVDKYLEY